MSHPARITKGPIMKRTLIWIAAIVGVAVAIGLAFEPMRAQIKQQMRTKYREAEVTKGRIVAVVNSTGTVKPIRSVQVGTFVSGPIIKLLVDFNDPVEKGQLLAVIDPQLYEPNVRRDEAVLATRNAELEQIKVKLQHAQRDEK